MTSFWLVRAEMLSTSTSGQLQTFLRLGVAHGRHASDVLTASKNRVENMSVRGRDQNFNRGTGTGENQEKSAVKKVWTKKGVETINPRRQHRVLRGLVPLIGGKQQRDRDTRRSVPMRAPGGSG